MFLSSLGGGGLERGGFDELLAHALKVDLEEGLVVNVASLDDVIASKETADRPNDRAQLPMLYSLREVLANREDERDS
jgi:hypothetical protein